MQTFDTRAHMNKYAFKYHSVPLKWHKMASGIK